MAAYAVFGDITIAASFRARYGPAGFLPQVYPGDGAGSSITEHFYVRKITSSRLNIFTASASAIAAYTHDEPKMSAR